MSCLSDIDQSESSIPLLLMATNHKTGILEKLQGDQSESSIPLLPMATNHKGGF